MSKDIAHKIFHERQWEVENGGKKFIRRETVYACGRNVSTVIEKHLANVPHEGWPEGTKLCKVCERRMRG